jgi:sulfate permease, SulP family
LRLKRARNPDAVGLGVLRAFIQRVRARDIHVLLCGVRTDFAVALQKTGIAQDLEEGSVFVEQPVRQTSTMQALEHAHGLLSAEHDCPLKKRKVVVTAEPQAGPTHAYEFDV